MEEDNLEGAEGSWYGMQDREGWRDLVEALCHLASKWMMMMTV